MKIRTEKLRAALELVAPAVGGRKVTLPVLRYVQVGEGSIAATDLEVRVQVELPEAQDPPFLIPHKLALDFLQAVPGDSETFVSPLDSTGVAFQSRSVRARFDLPKERDFPPRPELKEPLEAKVDGDVLVRAMGELEPYGANDDTRVVLHGVCLTLGDPVEVCAADGFRLAVRTLPFPLPKIEGEEGEQLIIPRAAVETLVSLWRKGEKPPELPEDGDLGSVLTARRPLRLRYTRQWLEASFGSVTLLTHLIEGHFPNYRQLIPDPQASRVTVLADAFRLALRQLEGVAKDGSGIVRLTWEGTTLKMSARGSEIGEVESEVKAQVEGEAGRIAFNLKYLQEFLKGKQGVVTFQAEAPSKPGLFTAPGAPKVVLMPMMVQWGDQPPPPPAPEASTPAEGSSEEDPFGPVAEPAAVTTESGPDPDKPGEGERVESVVEKAPAPPPEPAAPRARGRGQRRKHKS